MIKAEFFNHDDLIVGFRITGHAGYAEEGSDIVCSAVSSAAYMTANTVTDVLMLSPEISENDGYLRLKLKSHADAENAKDILNGFSLHIAELSKQYPRYITVINTEV